MKTKIGKIKKECPKCKSKDIDIVQIIETSRMYRNGKYTQTFVQLADDRIKCQNPDCIDPITNPLTPDSNGERFISLHKSKKQIEGLDGKSNLR